MRSSGLATLDIFGSKSKNPRVALCGVRTQGYHIIKFILRSGPKTRGYNRIQRIGVQGFRFPNCIGSITLYQRGLDGKFVCIKKDIVQYFELKIRVYESMHEQRGSMYIFCQSKLCLNLLSCDVSKLCLNLLSCDVIDVGGLH